MNKKSYIKVLIFIFLLLHIIPLFDRLIYQNVTLFNYSILLPIVALLALKREKSKLINYIYILMFLVALFMFIGGSSGSIGALILSASLPSYLNKYFKSHKDFIDLAYKPIQINAILLIVASYYVYSKTFDSLSDFDTLGRYFGIASINYVPLVTFSFSILFYVVIDSKRKAYNNVSKVDTLILLTLVLISLYFSTIYLTRTTFIGSIFLLFIAFVKQWRILIISFLVLFIYYFNHIINYLELFLGTSNINDLVRDDQRLGSISNIILDSITLGYNFKENMSFSSIINLIFSIFPLTLIFIYPLFSPFYKKPTLTLYSLLSVYLICFMITFYQMDFLSIFTLFFVINYITTTVQKSGYNSNKN